MKDMHLLNTEQHCGYCQKTTEHKVTLERGGFDVVAHAAPGQAAVAVLSR
jgi:hypothetical protein